MEPVRSGSMLQPNRFQYYDDSSQEFPGSIVPAALHHAAADFVLVD